jgi:hypothetical protein
MKTGFLEEVPEQKSWVRLQSLFLTLTAMYLTVISPFRPVSFEILLLVVLAAVAPKVVQKFAELKTTGKVNDNK